LHGLGPRAVYELLVELGREFVIRTAIETKVERYADRLSPELLRGTSGERIPPVPVQRVSLIALRDFCSPCPAKHGHPEVIAEGGLP
jgi:hypothetical protein